MDRFRPNHAGKESRIQELSDSNDDIIDCGGEFAGIAEDGSLLGRSGSVLEKSAASDTETKAYSSNLSCSPVAPALLIEPVVILRTCEHSSQCCKGERVSS